MPIVFVIAIVLWLVVAVLMFTQRSRRNRTIKSAAAKTGAPAETLSLGGLLSLLLVIGVFFGIGAGIVYGVQQLVF